MSLRVKISLIVLVAVLGYVGLAHTVQRMVVLPSFRDLEREEAQKDMERGVEALRREMHHLNQFTHDWSAWDDTYRFVQDHNQAFIDANLIPETFANYKLNLIIFLDTRGRIVQRDIRDLPANKPISLREFAPASLSPQHPLLAHKDIEDSVAGVLMTEHGPMLIAARPLVTSTYKGPIRGTLLMGRFLTADLVKTIAEQARVKLQLWPLQGNSLPAEARDVPPRISAQAPFFFREQGPEQLQVHATFPDLQGRPALLLRVDVPRNITARGRKATQFAQLSIMGVGLLLMGVLLGALRSAVVRPLGRLTAHAVQVGRSGDLSARLALPRRDEIGTLAREFDAMVEQLAQARQQLMEKTYRAGRAEMAAGVLHNIRNALSPMNARIDTLHRALQKVPLEQVEQARDELANNGSSPQRREDLGRFLELAQKSLFHSVREMQDQVVEIKDRAGKIERILMDQDPFSRAERPLERLSLEELVQEAVELMPDALRSALAVELDPSVAELGPVQGDRLTLLQVFANLLNNAAQSTQGTGRAHGEVRVRGEVEREAGEERIHLRICDNGPGVPAENLEKIFQRGFSTKGSSGLGLHWSANALNAMQGRLYAESLGNGTGTCMHLLLPRNL